MGKTVALIGQQKNPQVEMMVDAQNRARECMEAIQNSLKKWSCALNPKFVISALGTEPDFETVPRPSAIIGESDTDMRIRAENCMVEIQAILKQLKCGITPKLTYAVVPMTSVPAGMTEQ